ncbi:ATP-binding protein [Sediminibacterium ginsengisoli]|uniref:histidine kinase n=1 Tax=Sediminibacterium ginsengisoli TaxID=413434 RepID=A0A1T4QED6_9BACT|nr:ATP-binding protein [Sediminibacterium ginsengisoli]SKA01598.1 Bacteriophytochrome (light-regulated signal transduction histidine kinase) [Sediminibacterium ginsengisoli]
MKIKDIVNKDIVNLENCDEEPIHIPGSIQPHGFLAGITASGMIDFCSANVSNFISLDYRSLLGKPATALFDTEDPLQLLATAAAQPQSSVTVSCAGKSFSCFVHKSGDTIIAELEPAQADSLQLTALYNLSLDSIHALQSSDTLQKLCQNVASQIRKITGYDRVMVYRFDEDYNGEVFAEEREEYLEPFLGLRYPHTDIPAQARQLYIKNLLRVIVDVDYTPAPLFTIDDAKDKNLDLGMASLRSVSPIHIAYLQNIGVRATLTISLLHEGKLWGLIACHHYSGPKHLSAYTRVSAQLMAQLLTSQIRVREVAEEYEIAKRVNTSLEQLLLYPNELNRLSFADMVQRPELLEVCKAGGIAIMHNDVIYKAGNTPADDKIRQLLQFLDSNNHRPFFQTTRLSAVYPEAGNDCNTASGILYYALEGHGQNCIIWFRPETNEEVHWAGDPDKAIIKNEKGLSPRNSFALWRQIIKCRSLRWENPEISATGTFANALQKHIHMLALSEEEIKYRELSVQLKEANDELENINWISTHDLKEPLRKIQVFSSRILSREQKDVSEVVIDSLRKMNASANRMQRLITDITSYARLRHTDNQHLDVNLNELLKEVIAEIKEDVNDLSRYVVIDDLPVVKGVELLLHQLFVNLIRNAIKFRRKDVELRIRISCLADQPYEAAPDPARRFSKITISDNGIGLDNIHKENIFKVFTRLHNQSEYAGSGVGLALCRQIMQMHNGYITADGTPGAGTDFHLYFPA